MAIFKDFIEADCKATKRSGKLLMNRARRLRDAKLISTKGHGLSAARMTVDDAVAYTLGSFTTFSKAVDAPDEVRAFSGMPIRPESLDLITAKDFWPLEGDYTRETFSTLGGTIKSIYELLLNDEQLNSDQWNGFSERYESGDISLRKSRDTRDATISFIPHRGNSENEKMPEILYINYHREWPDEYSVDCPVWEAVTVPFSILGIFASLLKNGEQSVDE